RTPILVVSMSWKRRDTWMPPPDGRERTNAEMTDKTTTVERTELWGQIERSGGIDAWVRAELASGGYAVARRDTGTLSKGPVADYKKALKAEAAARKQLSKQAWLAYKATHIVHLGDNVFWNDAADIDRYDLDEPEARAAENELPEIDDAATLARLLEIDV